MRKEAVGDLPTRRARKAWDTWLRRFGNPAQLLLGELAAMHAVTQAVGGNGVVTLAPLGRVGMADEAVQFRLDKINVPVIRASEQLSVADLIGLADGITDDEFEAEFRRWLSQRGPIVRAAQDPPMYAGPGERPVSPHRSKACPAAWPRCRPCLASSHAAPATVAGIRADSAVNDGSRRLSQPAPDKLTWSSYDLDWLVNGAARPPRRRGSGPQSQVEALFAEMVPKGEEDWIISFMAGRRHQDVIRLLELLGHSPSKTVD